LDVTVRPMYDSAGLGSHIGGVLTLRDTNAERENWEKQGVMYGDAHFKKAADQLPQIIFLAAPNDGQVQWYNDTFYHYTGVSQEECLGSDWHGIVHEDDLGGLGTKWSHALKSGEVFQNAYRIKRYDGIYRWYLGRASPMKNSELGEITRWFGSVTDIHDQVEALSASRQAQRQYQSIINYAAITLWAVDRQGIITVAEGPGVGQLLTRDKNSAINEQQTGQDWEYKSSREEEKSDENMIGRSIYSVWDLTNIKESIGKA
jgi:PAS domain S-box-containing protein